jgi:hypothetical protein
MIDLFLRFSSESAAKTYLYDIEYTPYIDEEGMEVLDERLTPRYRNMDIIGTIYTNQAYIGPPEEIDGYSFMPDPVFIPLPGWHVNIRALDDEDITSLEPFRVFPTNPRRMWA